MRTETSTAANFKEGSQAYYAAEAGVNRAIIELLRVAASSRSSVFAGSEGDEEQEDGSGENSDDTDGASDELRLWVAGGGPYRFELGDFFCEVSVIDENNKVNINSFLNQAANDPTRLKSLLESQIGLEGEERDLVADSLLDWWDKDSNVTGTLGAEDDYYGSLDPPYPCRNGDLPVIEDCLLVRGVTQEVFYGQGRRMEERIVLSPDELEQFIAGGGLGSADDFENGEGENFVPEGVAGPRLGLVDVFSVTSSTTSLQVNINSASFEQLVLLPGMDAKAAREIITERARRLFESPTDRLPQYPNYEVWKEMIRVQRPFAQNTYTIVSRGVSRDGRISRTVRCSLLVSASKCIISDWRTGG
jgi:type II secretory pathway component PulK